MKSKKKILISVISLCFVLAIGLGIAGYNYNQKYDTETMLANMETLTEDQMLKLTERTIIIDTGSAMGFTDERATSVKQYGMTYVLTYDNTEDANDAFNKYSKDNTILSCSYDTVVKTQDVYTDTEYTASKQALSSEVDLTPTGNEVTIAVIDSGANGNYSGLSMFTDDGNITDVVGHGTKMCTIIDNVLAEYSGQYQIVPIKIANDNGVSSVSMLIKALQVCLLSNYDVVNISLSSLNTSYRATVESIIDSIVNSGTTVVVSAGNNSDDTIRYIPACISSATVVGSCDDNGDIKSFSNYGESIDFLIESNSTSEAAATFSAIAAKSAVNKSNLKDSIINSKVVHSYVGKSDNSLVTENNVDTLEYNVWQLKWNAEKYTATDWANLNYGASETRSAYYKTDRDVYIKDAYDAVFTIGVREDYTDSNGNYNMYVFCGGSGGYIPAGTLVHGSSYYHRIKAGWDTCSISKSSNGKDQVINQYCDTLGVTPYLMFYRLTARTGYHYSDAADTEYYTTTNTTSSTGSAVQTGSVNTNLHVDDVGTLQVYLGATSRIKTVQLYWEPNTYSVVYNANGGSGSMSNSSHTYDVAKNLTANAYSKTGYKFVGWNSKSDGTGVSFANQASVKNLTTSNGGTYTLYAQWTPCTVTVKFNKNDGSSDTYTEIYTYNVSDQTFGMNLTQRAVLGFCGWTRTGYGIVGWSESSTATPSTPGLYGVYSTVGNSWISPRVGTTVNLYAVWKPKALTVNYKSNNGNDQTYKETYYYGTNGQKLAYKYTGTEIAGGFGAFIKTGYSFVGWNEKSNASHSGSLYTRNQDVGWSWINSKVGDQFSNSLNLYCIWKPNTYKAIFDKQKGSGGTDSVNSVYDSSERDNVTIPTRTGYIFGGYYTQKDGKGTQWWNAGGESIANTWKVASDFTFYAYWIPVTAEVTFYRNLDSSDTVTNTQIFTYDVANQKFASTGWTKTGYKFNGYSTDRNATSGPYSLNNSVSNDWILAHVNGISLYTTWKPLEYKVVYNANGGTGSLTETWIYDTAHETYNNAIGKKFQKTGYYIDYWYTTSDSCNYGSDAKFKAGGGYSGSKAISTNTAEYTNLITPDKDGDTITLYAHWAPIRYKITFGNDTTNTGHGEVYTTSTFFGMYSYGNTYSVPTTVFERSNKFGESEFLGFSLKNGDTSLRPLLCNIDSPDDVRTTSNVRFMQGIFSSSKTTEGTTYANYFRYLPIGDIQSFALYAVYNDCPGISPVDAYYNMDTVKGAAVLGTNPATASTTELESKLLSINAKTIYDRESGTTAVPTDSSHYYCEVLQLSTMQNQNVVTSYEIKYTITDKRGLKYTQSAMLYSGHTVDIKVN